VFVSGSFAGGVLRTKDNDEKHTYIFETLRIRASPVTARGLTYRTFGPSSTGRSNTLSR